DALHAALEDREVAFDRVGMGGAADVFAGGVLDRLMAGEFLSGPGVDRALGGLQGAFARDVADQNLGGFRASSAIDVEAAGLAAALDQGDDGALAGRAGLALPSGRRQMLPAGLRRGAFAEIGFVGLDVLALAAERAGRGNIVGHGFADAMRHE